MSKTYVVTGGHGFIGSNFVNYICETTDDSVIVIDSNTYAANPNYIKAPYVASGQVRSIVCDIATEPDVLDRLFSHTKVDGIFNFAAETHVDNSITDPNVFIKTNIVGTYNLLEGVRKNPKCRFLQISTDEVYGSLSEYESSFTEVTNLSPSSVYSASKASADLLVGSYNKTYNLDTIITRCCNNYGSRQHSEKLIPKTIISILNNREIPVYGKGDNIREWIHVQDHCVAIKSAFDMGKSGEIYNIGSGVEVQNVVLVKKLLHILEKPLSLIKFVNDRPGHDHRYSIDCSKLKQTTRNRWVVQYDAKNFDEGLKHTIQWYKENTQST